jgi:hypothetical protein
MTSRSKKAMAWAWLVALIVLLLGVPAILWAAFGWVSGACALWVEGLVLSFVVRALADTRQIDPGWNLFPIGFLGANLMTPVVLLINIT